MFLSFVSQAIYEALNEKVFNAVGCLVEHRGHFQLRRITLNEAVQQQNQKIFVQARANEQRTQESYANVVRKQTETIQSKVYANITILQSVAENNYLNVTQSADANVEKKKQIAQGY